MLAEQTIVPQVFEAVMLVCFGVSWPLSILKAWRTRRVEGKSIAFVGMIFFGYIAGLCAKFAKSIQTGQDLEFVTAAYALNAVLVGVDMALFLAIKTGRLKPRAPTPSL